MKEKNLNLIADPAFIAACYALQGLLARPNDYYHEGEKGLVERAVTLGLALVEVYDGPEEEPSEDF
jgi:hypothetical protein